MAIKNAKYIMGLLGLVVILLIAVPAYWYQAITATADVEHVVASQLSNELGRHVDVGSIKISPFGGINAKDVRVDDEGQIILIAPEVLIKYNIFYLFGQNPLNGLRSVTFQQPEIYVNRSTLSGEWNIIRFFKDLKKPSRSLAIDTDFRIVDGHLIVTDGKQTVEFEKINGEFKFNSNANLSVQIVGLLEGRPAEVKGFINTQKGTYGLQIDAEVTRTDTLAAWLPKSEIILEKGSIHTSVFLLQEQFQPLQFSGEVTVEDAAVKVLKTNYEMSGITGKLLINDKAVFVQGITARLNGEPVSITGDIAIDGRQPYLDVIIQSDSIAIQKALPDKEIPVEGKMQIKLHAFGPLDDLHVQGSAELKAGVVNGVPVENGKVNLNYYDSWVDIHSMQAEVYHGTVQGQGVIKLAEIPVYSVFLQVNEVEYPNPTVTGLVTASLYATGRGADDISTVWGAGFVKQGTLLNVPFDTIDTGFYWEKGQLQLSYFKLSLDEGWLQASGTGTKQQLNFDVHGYNLPLERFAVLMGNINITGLGNLTGKLQGSYDAPYLNGSFTAINGKVLEQSYTDASGQLILTKEKIALENVVLVHKDTIHKIAGAIIISPNVIVDLSITTENALADELIKLIDPGMHNVRGKVNNSILVRGPITNLEMQGQVVLTQGKYNEQRIDYAKTRYVLHNGLWRFEDGLLTVGSASLQIAGTMDQQKILDLNFTAQKIMLEELDPKIVPFKMGGRTELAGTITGTPDNLQIRSNIKTYAAVINGQQFGDLTGRFELIDNILIIPELRLIENAARYEFAGRIDFSQEGQIDGVLTVQDGQLQQLLGLLGYPIPDAQGIVTADLILSGPMDRPNAQGHLIVTKGNIKGYPVDKISIDLAVNNGLITVNTLELLQGKGFMRARGTWDMHGVIALEVGGRDLDAGFVSALLPNPQPVTGLVNFTAQIGGTSESPQAAMSLEIKQGSWAQAEFDSLYGLALLDHDMLKLNQVILIKGPYRASAYGTIPVAAMTAKGRAEPNSPAGMDIRMRLDQADLSILPLLSQDVAWAVGKTLGEVHISGNLYQPYINGHFNVPDGTIRLKASNTPIEHANIDVEFAGDKIHLNAFNGQLGGGTYTGSGEATLKGFSLTDLNFNLKLDKLYVNSKYYIGTVQGDLTLKSADRMPVLKGNVVLVNATLLPPTLWPEGDDFLPNLRLDLELQADKNVRLRNAALYDMYIQGKIKAQGSIKHPVTSGRISVTRGSLQYLNTSFKISEGVADFNQYDSFLPSIRVVAEARVLDTKVKLRANGPLAQMDFQFTSEPPLSQQQIITLLTLRSRGSSSGGESGGVDGNDQLMLLLNEGLQFTFVQRVETVVQDFLGLDEVHIVRGQNERVTDKEVYKLEVGKFITDKFFVSYTMGNSNTGQIFRYRYDITNHLAIDGEFGSKNDKRLGVEARFFF